MKLSLKDDPEEIAKWIEDRKRNYPTEANKLLKEQEYLRKLALGEINPSEKSKKKDKRKRDNEEGTSDSKKRSRTCVYFAKGKCKNGDECRYAHADKEDQPLKTHKKEIPAMKSLNVHKRMNLFRMVIGVYVTYIKLI